MMRAQGVERSVIIFELTTHRSDEVTGSYVIETHEHKGEFKSSLDSFGLL